MAKKDEDKKTTTRRRKKGPAFSKKEAKAVMVGAILREFAEDKVNEQFSDVQVVVPFGEKPKAKAADIAAIALAWGIWQDSKMLRKYRGQAVGFAAPQLADLIQRVRGVK